MDRWLISFIQGALLSLFFTSQPSVFYINVFIILGLLCLCLKKLRFIGAILLGVSWVHYHGVVYNDIYQVNQIDKQSVSQAAKFIDFEVVDIPQIKAESIKFAAEITVMDGQTLKEPIFARLTFSHKYLPQSSVREFSFQQGQYWRVKAKLKPAHGVANPDSFSYQRWLREKGYHVTGYIYSKPQALPILLDSDISFRQQLFNQVNRSLEHNNYRGLVLALGFGERYAISKQQWSVLQETNTSHLIAISGLHIGLIFGFSLLLLSLLARVCVILLGIGFKTSSLSLLTHANIRILLLSSALCCAAFYAYLANFSMPTIRALIMLCLYVGSVIFAYQMTRTRLLLLTVCIILMFEPLAFISPSFWLSFIAVSTIFLVLWRTENWRITFSETIASQLMTRYPHLSTSGRHVKIKQWTYALSSALFIQLGLSVLLMPVTALLYQQVSLSSIAANLVAVPWMSIFTIPLVLLSIVETVASGYLNADSIRILEWLSTVSLKHIFSYLSWLASYEYMRWLISETTWLILTVCIVIILGLCLSKRVTGTLSVGALAMVVGVGGVLLANLNQGSWQIRVFDVGHGLSVLIERNGKVILYDTGAGFPNGFSFAQAAILPHLTAKKIQTIDYLVLSHNDNDHQGGYAELANRVELTRVLSSYPVPLLKSQKPRPKLLSCNQSFQVAWQGLSIEILSIKSEQSGHKSPLSDNDMSCVIRIGDGKQYILLPGDVTHKVESMLVRSHENKINADVLIAPHHGSKTSSTVKFIDAVSPQIVIFSTGHLNRWNMPHKQVKDRYQKQGISMLNTADVGSILITFSQKHGSNPISIETQRQDERPFWIFN